MESTASNSAAFEIPEELTGSLPRPVCLAGDGVPFIAAIVLIGFFGCGILCGWAAIENIQEVKHRAILRDEGRVVSGEVTGFASSRGGTYVKYKFPVHGETFFGEAMMPDRRLILNKADQIPVRFLPSNPQINHPDAWEWSPLKDLPPQIFLLFLFGMGTFAWIAPLRERKLARMGKPVEGRVTNCYRDKSVYRIEYEFCTEDAQEMSGKGYRKDCCEIGASICIIYLPQKPSRNQTYPLSLYSIPG